MEKTKRKRAVYLELSGVCAIGAVLWFFGLMLMEDVFGIGIVALYPNPFNPFAYLAVFLFVKGFVPAKRTALKIIIAACTVVLLAYVAIVAFVKVDFISVLPIHIACGLTPVLAAFGVMLFYDGKRWRKILCATLAAMALCISTWTLLMSLWNNYRETVGYSKSPGGTNRVVVLHCNGGFFGFNRDIVSPAYGIWYNQRNFDYASDPEAIIWLDENTATINANSDYPLAISFK